MNAASCSSFRPQESAPCDKSSFIISSNTVENVSKGLENDTLKKQDFYHDTGLGLLGNTDDFDFVKLREQNFEQFLLKTMRNEALLKEDSNQDNRMGLQHLPNTKAQFFKCEICRKGFQRKYTLNRHLRSHLPNPVRYQCKVCGRAYMHRYHLKRHFDAHCAKVSIMSTQLR